MQSILKIEANHYAFSWHPGYREWNPPSRPETQGCLVRLISDASLLPRPTRAPTRRKRL